MTVSQILVTIIVNIGGGYPFYCHPNRFLTFPNEQMDMFLSVSSVDEPATLQLIITTQDSLRINFLHTIYLYNTLNDRLKAK